MWDHVRGLVGDRGDDGPAVMSGRWSSEMYDIDMSTTLSRGRVIVIIVTLAELLVSAVGAVCPLAGQAS